MSNTRRFCPKCRVKWNATIGQTDWCPRCRAGAFCTMNAGDMGAAMYLNETGENLEEYTEVPHPEEGGEDESEPQWLEIPQFLRRFDD